MFKTSRTCLLVLIGLMAMPMTSAIAQPILIDFEQITGMGNAAGSVIPAESRLADQYLASHHVRFTSGAPFVAVVVHGPGTPSGTRIIGGSTASGTLSYRSTEAIVAQFLDASGTVPLVVSVVSVRGDLFPIAGTKTLEAYNVRGDLIGVDTQPDSSPNPLMVSAPGIHRVRMFSQSATVGFDDLRFDTPRASTCEADFNGDGILDPDDLADYIGAFFSQPPGSGSDFNGDGVTDPDDLADFIGVFFAGC